MKCFSTPVRLYLFTLVFAATQVGGEEQLQLVNFLFNESRYDERILPSVGQNGPVDVVVGLAIYRIEDLVEKSQQLITHGVLYLTWNDPNLAWKQSHFGGLENITVNTGQIWLPDIVLYNSATEDYFSRRLGRIRPTVHYDGNVSLHCPVRLRTTCSIDVEDYPMDEQECALVFGSWGHHSGQISVKSTPNKINLQHYIVNGEWEITGTSFEQHLVYYEPNAQYGFYDVTFSLRLRRRVLFYAVYLIGPGTLIALLSAIIFILPQDCSERITVGMAILVALSFFFLLVSENTPASSKVSIIGGYYAATMVEMTICFFLNVLVLRFHHMTDEEVPDWVKRYILNYGAKLLRMKFDVNNKKLENVKRTRLLLSKQRSLVTNVDQGTIPTRSRVHDKIIAETFEKKIKMAERDAEWKKAAEVLNIFSLILHILVVVFTFVLVFF